MMSAQEAAWHEIVRDTLKANSVKLVTYVRCTKTGRG
jgi:hypothetical protein